MLGRKTIMSRVFVLKLYTKSYERHLLLKDKNDSNLEEEYSNFNFIMNKTHLRFRQSNKQNIYFSVEVVHFT